MQSTLLDIVVLTTSVAASPLSARRTGHNSHLASVAGYRVSRKLQKNWWCISMAYRPCARASTCWVSFRDVLMATQLNSSSVTHLHNDTIPKIGGDTLWASGYAAYEKLSPDFRKIIDVSTMLRTLDTMLIITVGQGGCIPERTSLS